MIDSGSFSGNNEAADDHTKKKKKKKKQINKVSMLKLFSFADSYDYLLMAIGSVGACVHGAAVPVFFIFFGKLINIIGMAYLFPKEASHKVAKVLHSTMSMHAPVSWPFLILIIIINY
jgi:ATP-binding cassette subfamily B (MDR/TAP) protein 1